MMIEHKRSDPPTVLDFLFDTGWVKSQVYLTDIHSIIVVKDAQGANLITEMLYEKLGTVWTRQIGWLPGEENCLIIIQNEILKQVWEESSEAQQSKD